MDVIGIGLAVLAFILARESERKANESERQAGEAHRLAGIALAEIKEKADFISSSVNVHARKLVEMHEKVTMTALGVNMHAVDGKGMSPVESKKTSTGTIEAGE